MLKTALELRTLADLTPVEAAKALNVSPATIHKWESTAPSAIPMPDKYRPKWDDILTSQNKPPETPALKAPPSPKFFAKALAHAQRLAKERDIEWTISNEQFETIALAAYLKHPLTEK